MFLLVHVVSTVYVMSCIQLVPSYALILTLTADCKKGLHYGYIVGNWVK